MANSELCKEMASVSPTGVHQRLTAFFASTACDLFDESQKPNTMPDDTRVRDELFTPLQWLLCGGEPAMVFESLEERQDQSNICGRVFSCGEQAFRCKDCQTDPARCLCMECFENSEHKNHHYKLYASGGGGCCDCGDPESWTSFVHCNIHKPAEQEGPEVDPVDALSPDLANRSPLFFSTLLWYCMDMLCWEDTHSLPESIMQGKTSESLAKPTFLSFLYNDEDHPADEVIFSLIPNMEKSHTDAIMLAMLTKRKGRAVVRCGSEEECLESKELINKDLASGVPLKVMVFHSAVAAHQTNAVLCLSLLKEMAEKLAFRRLISEALVQVSNSAGCCILDRYFLNDSKMWITARIRWHRLVMISIFKDPKYKLQLAINLTKNYSELLKNFVDDSHEFGVSASNITIQFFAVPSLSHMLVKSHGLFQKIIGTLIQLISPCKNPNTGVLELTSRNYKHSRICYIMNDLGFVLSNKPGDLSGMKEPVLEAFKLMLDLLGMVQNAGPVKRQQVSHVTWEEPWESVFDFFVSLQQPLVLFIDWCTADQTLLREAVRLTVKKHEEVANRTRLQYQMHGVSQALIEKDRMELYVCDLLKEPVSVHQPLPRVLAGLLVGANSHNMSLSDLLQISPTDVQTPLFLMEHSSRVIVMAVQVLAGMWRRNGTSVVHQVIAYQFKYPRDIMYDKDIVMLQAMAAILDPSVFLYALVYKFRLDTWVARPESDPSSNRGENPEDALRFFLSETEEFMFLLIAIFCERFVKGVGGGMTTSESLKQDMIHKLLISPLPHSQIVKEFVHITQENENEIDKVLKEVATLRKGGGSNRSEFVLKTEYEMEYNPFHYHYSRADHSMAEDARRKRMKSRGAVVDPESVLLRELPPFCTPFQGIMRLSTCPVMHRIFQCVFTHAADAESKVWSDRLLYEALYLCAMMLREEDSTHNSSLCNAANGRYGANQFLDALNTLLTSKRAEDHKPLLLWITKFLKDHRGEGTGQHSPPTEVVEEAESDQPQGSRSRQELANKRQRVMAQMQNMQRRFLERNKKEMEDGEGEDQIDTGTSQSLVASPPVHAVSVDSLISHTAEPKEVTCILCQEVTKDFASQEKVLVQAVRVQQSCVLKRGEDSTGKERDYLAANANLSQGTCTSGCGHHIHADCWKQFIENKRKEHSRRHFFPLPGQSVQWATGEFLCPLCQCFNNTILPLLPPFSSTVPSQIPLHTIGFSEWRDIVRLAMELAESEDDPLQYASTSPTLWDKLQELFSNFQKPSAYYQRSHNDMASVVGLFTQSTYMRAYKTDPDEANERVCVATWNNCAYTISSLQMSLRQEGKLLFTGLSTRQLDCLSSLAKMGCDPKLRPSRKQLCGHLRKLMSSFLLESSLTEDVPSVVECDTFFMMVYLHSAVVSLLASLVSPSGCLNDSPILPALTGVTMQHVVRAATAARLVQYLLCYPPGSGTDSEGSAQVGEDGEGAALQNLWLTFRQQANFPSGPPPDPSSLLSDVRDYLNPFLQCAVLFCQSFTGINFVQPEDKSSLFSEMCKFLNLPTELHTLFEETAQASQYSIRNLANIWCGHNRLPELVREASILLQPRSVIDLPHKFSELFTKASAFKCPNRVEGDDVNQAVMLCLLCGKMLCINSHCCTFEVEGKDGSEKLRVGGFTHHTQSCSGGVGMGLWIQEAYVVLLDATDLYRVRGCILTPPYLDEYGEPDPGLRRGNALYLHEESVQDLQKVWFQHRVLEKIIEEMESNRGQMKITWSQI